MNYHTETRKKRNYYTEMRKQRKKKKRLPPAALLIPLCAAVAVCIAVAVYLHRGQGSGAEKYYRDNSKLIDMISLEDSYATLNEMQAMFDLAVRGFAPQFDDDGNRIGYPVTYHYAPDGGYVEETEVSIISTDKHPMYQTFYVSGDTEGDRIGWVIDIINGEVFARPVSFGLETTCDKEILLTEDKEGKFTSYCDGTFYITVPHKTAVTTVIVDKINAETLDGITFDDLCDLTGAVRLPSAGTGSGEGGLAAASSSNVRRSSTLSASGKDTAIIVSLGDSFSSGEGIEDFIDQNLPWPERVQSMDFLAHRSENSWPRQLTVPGKNVKLYFAAASGAETIHIDTATQKKEYFKIFRSLEKLQISGSKCLPVQLDIFDTNKITGKAVDFVTLTIGGNDVGFASIILECVVGSSYLENAIYKGTVLEAMLNNTWAKVDTYMANIKRVYGAIAMEAPYAAIIVAGYPKLLDKNGKGEFINKQEAELVNNAVSAFNTKIKELVNECWESGMNIYFVDIETQFDNGGGHQAYSKNEKGEDIAWINPIWLLKSEDINDWKFASDYSIHPNRLGAQAYAMCVNAEIADYAESGDFGSNLHWKYDIRTDTLTISGTGEMPNYKAVDIGQASIPWYRFIHRIKEVIIEDGVTAIGDYAFAGFDKLKSVEISSTVSKIGDRAFWSCDKLSAVSNFPERLTDIGRGAFYGTALTDFYFASVPPTAWEASVSTNDISFAYGAKGDTSKITLHYPSALKNKWDPDGDGKWKGYRVEPYDMKVSGTVYDRETYERVPNTTVQIKKQDDEKVYEIVTDANGNFTVNLPGLDPVLLAITVSAEGYESQTLHQTADTRGLQLLIHLAPAEEDEEEDDDDETDNEPGEIEIVRGGPISLGNAYSAVITEDGSLYMWGMNGAGQLGNGTIENKSISTPIKIMDNVVSVSLGDNHSAAITTDGSLYMWGSNGFYGKLGNGTTENKSISTPIKIMDNVAYVSLGYDHSAAITEDGSLYTWGYNGHHQLGNGKSGRSTTPVKIMDNVAYVSLGEFHSAAVTTDGSLYTWGENRYGQLGNGTKNDSFVPKKIMDNVAYVSLGYNHSAAITTDGSLYMWGENIWGQLGNGERGAASVSRSPVKIMDHVVCVSLGYIHSAAITEDGSLYTWGDNRYGQLGNGTENDSSVPQKIMDNVAYVSLGYYHSAAVTTDGSLYMWGVWGKNYAGQNVNEEVKGRSTPQKITIPDTSD